jgi:hypothetical protein
MLNEKSRVRRESQARFCERLGLKCPCLLDPKRSALGRQERKLAYRQAGIYSTFLSFALIKL